MSCALSNDCCVKSGAGSSGSVKSCSCSVACIGSMSPRIMLGMSGGIGGGGNGKSRLLGLRKSSTPMVSPV